MAKYIVEVREVWTQAYVVEADSEEAAVKAVPENGEAISMTLEYSHTPESTEDWEVKLAEESRYQEDAEADGLL